MLLKPSHFELFAFELRHEQIAHVAFAFASRDCSLLEGVDHVGWKMYSLSIVILSRPEHVLVRSSSPGLLPRRFEIGEEVVGIERGKDSEYPRSVCLSLLEMFSQLRKLGGIRTAVEVCLSAKTSNEIPV